MSSVGERGPRLMAMVGHSRQAVLIRLKDERIVSISDGGARIVGLAERDVIGRKVSDLIDRREVDSSLRLMRLGYIDFYRAHRTKLKTGIAALISVCLHAVEIDGERYALGDFGLAGSAALSTADLSAVDWVLGTLDRNWHITGLSDNATAALGMPPADLMGRTLRLLGPPQLRTVGALVRADLATIDAVSLGMRVQAPPELARNSVLAVVLMGAENPHPDQRYVIFVPARDALDGDASARVSELEHYLWRIAAEVEASGILDRLGDVPARLGVPPASGLSPRKWEVLRRLLLGQRVATIAAELFISQSTVRNHLSAIFERFGVNSQSELLAHFSENKRSV